MFIQKLDSVALLPVLNCPKSKSTSDNNELLRVAKLLLAQAQATSEEESDSSNASAHSEVSTSKDPYRSQFQDTQDPFV